MERTFLRWLRGELGHSARLPLGLLDDAAVVRGIDRDRCVVTSDLLAEGVHFDLALAGAARVGRKTLAVNLSDLAAMAAQPIAAFVSVLLPAGTAHDIARELYQGILPLARDHDIAIGGGDTNVWNGPLVISVTVVGEAPESGVLTRKGAQPGDSILVTGPLGGSIDAHHLDFRPRVKEAVYLHSTYQLHAGMDISDGLLLDLDRMSEASGCAACLQMDTIPVSQAARELSCCVVDPEAAALRRALSDGEDFELVLAVPSNEATSIVADPRHGLTCTIIGEFVEGEGLWELKAEAIAAKSHHADMSMADSDRNTITLEAGSEAETETIAKRFARIAPPGSIVVLSGTLGAGKTRFVKAFAAACSVNEDEVASPTFILCKHYNGTQPICHMDVYRLGDIDEFESLGPEDLYASEGITFIEWGERVCEALPTERFEISIAIVNENARRFQFTALGERLVPMIDELCP